MNRQLTPIFPAQHHINLTLFGSIVIALLIGLAIFLRPSGSAARASQPNAAVLVPTATQVPQQTQAPLVHLAQQVVPTPTTPVVKPVVPTPEADTSIVQRITDVQPATEATPTTTQIGFVANSGNVYEGPGTEYAQVSTVEPGDVVELMYKVDTWWWIQTSDIQGWVSTSLLLGDGEMSTPSVETPAAEAAAPASHAPDPAAISGLVTLAGAVYAGPGTDYATIANVDAGTTLELLGATGAWWQVWVGQSVGWINEALLLIPPEALEQPAKQAAPAAPTPAAPTPAPPAPAESLWQVKVVPGTLVQLPEVTAPKPYLYADVVRPFLRARTRVYQASGVDYLAHLDEAFRGVDFETTKQGVASMSWHKAGRAVDLAQSRRVNGFAGVAFIRDTGAKNLYRVLIRCARQDGSLGKWYGPKALAGAAGTRQPAFYVDVTAIMLNEGFKRIPPQGAVLEAWHYELRGDLKWSTAMNQLYPVRMLRRLYPQVWR